MAQFWHGFQDRSHLIWPRIGFVVDFRVCGDSEIVEVDVGLTSLCLPGPVFQLVPEFLA